MSTQETIVSIRLAVPTDVPFLLKTWLREMREFYPRSWPDRVYYNDFQTVILQLMGRADARVVCAASDPNYIVGFIVGEILADAKTALMHFAYMRPPYRRAGYCRAAMEDMGYQTNFEIICTHWSEYLDRFDRRNIIYNPLTLYEVRK